MAEGSRFAKSLRNPFQWITAGLILLVIVIIAVGPLDEHPRPHASHVVEMAWTIDRILLAYADDHNGAFPAGKSSTEIFQKLLNEKYCTDPSIFYIKMPGKARPTSTKLEPKNVSWDVTVSSDTDFDNFPVVFLTGYKVNYIRGGIATPLFLHQGDSFEGIAVGYDGTGIFIHNDGLPDGIVRNLIGASFNPTGKTYQQLTPDGPLAP